MFPSRLLGVVSVTCLIISPGCASSPESEPNVVSKRLLLTLEGNTGSATCVAYSADGKLIASCHREKPGQTESEDPQVKPSGRPKSIDMHREVKVWDAYTGKERIALNKGTITWALAFFPNNQNLAGAVGDMVKIWDSTTGKENLVLKGHTDAVHDLDISRDGKRLATASSDGTVKIWDTLTAVCLHSLQGHSHGVFHVSFSPDGKRIVGTGGESDHKGEILIWDWATEKQVMTLTQDTPMGKALFSPDGKHIACYRDQSAKHTRPGLVGVWNVASGTPLFLRKSHSEEVTCIAYSPDGELLASGSKDGTVIVREGAMGEEVVKLTTHGNGTTPFELITSIAFSPGGSRLATASWDGTVKVWDMKDVTADKDPKANKKKE